MPQLADVLKALKSVEEITDPDKIYERMDAAVKCSIVSTAHGPHTIVLRDDDGRPRIRKATALTTPPAAKALPSIPTGDDFTALFVSRGL
jgi:hypothetical protein